MTGKLTSIRKRFRVSNKVKKVASKDRFRLCISREFICKLNLQLNPIEVKND